MSLPAPLPPPSGAVPLADAAADWAGARRVEAGRWRVRYREAGRGPTVVLAHGLGVSADGWLRNGPALAAAGFRVLAPDLPGFGATDGPPRLTVPAQARALAAFARALGLGPAAYVGHSLGCAAALALAVRRPSQVRALVLAAPTGDRRRGRLSREAWGLARDAFREPPEMLVWMTWFYLRAGPRRFARTWVAGKGHDPFALAHRVRAPALVLVGDRDPVVPLPFARALAHAMPRGRFACVPGGAHGVIFDAPDAFNAQTAAFLRAAG